MWWTQSSPTPTSRLARLGARLASGACLACVQPRLSVKPFNPKPQLHVRASCSSPCWQLQRKKQLQASLAYVPRKGVISVLGCRCKSHPGAC